MIRVFPRKNKWLPTDDLAFIGAPPRPLFLPEDQPVRISVTFTWDIPYGQQLLRYWSFHYSDVKIGGVAFGDQGNEFVPGRFIKEGVTFTSRGCPKNCKWCFVPKREGKIRELKIKDGYIIQDNNLLACNRKHIEAVFDMLRRQRKGAEFPGGIDATLLQDWHRDLFDTIRYNKLFFACDTPTAIKHLQKASKIFKDISQNKKYCYVMIGFNGETVYDAEKRLEAVYNLDFMPFSQLYQNSQKKQYSKEWKELNRKWSRPAAYKSYMKNKNQ